MSTTAFASGVAAARSPSDVAARRPHPTPKSARAAEAATDESAWALLDDAAQWSQFSRKLPGDGDRWESYLAIEGMYCPACSLTVEQALTVLPGVRAVQVNGATAIARIEWEAGHALPSAWLGALRKAGYAGLPAGDQLAALPRLRAQRRMLWRWLVAGFCMMQVMMYAVPAYVAGPGEMTPDVRNLLRWASWLLSLPVVLFSCGPFFESAWRDLRARRIGMDVPVSLGILIAFVGSTVGTFDPDGPLGQEVWYDSLTMFVFFLLSGRMLELRLRERTAGALQSLARRLPEQAERETAEGGTERVVVARLVPGDCIRVRAGEVFPADGTVVEGESQVDEALLSGESHPLARRAGDAVVAGSHNLSGTLRVWVERTGRETRFAEIVTLMERASVDKPRIARLAERIAGPFLVGVLLAAAAAAWWWWPQGPGQALGIAVAVLIVTCPCALSLATPTATLTAAAALARRGILVRRMAALEQGATIDTVVFDKTGTLTQDRMTVAEVLTRPGVETVQALALAAALARHSLHPAARAVVQAADGAGAQGGGAEAVQEHAGAGLYGRVRTAGEHEGGHEVRELWLGSEAFCRLTPQARAMEASRVPATAQVHLADAQGWLATFVLDERVRLGARAALARLARMGLDTWLLSGDRPVAVERLAARLGIARAQGGQQPQDKLEVVRQAQQSGRRMAMVGDGMNDGPVLARADLSIAVGQGVPIAQAQADVVVPGGQLAAVPLLLAQARRTRRIVRQNLAWAAGYNALCVPLALVGWMPAWLAGLGMALSSLVVVGNAARLARLPRRWSA